MGHINRPRTREYAPTNSGSLSKPERINIRCTTEQCGRAYAAFKIARQLRQANQPDAVVDACTAFNEIIIPTFEKVVRAYLCGSSAERQLAAVYLEERIRKDDYLSKRRQFTQQAFDL